MRDLVGHTLRLGPVRDSVGHALKQGPVRDSAGHALRAEKHIEPNQESGQCLGTRGIPEIVPGNSFELRS